MIWRCARSCGWYAAFAHKFGFLTSNSVGEPCASVYEQQIDRILKQNGCPVLIELAMDLRLPYVTELSEWAIGKLLVVDHHDCFGGPNTPSSLEQICGLLQISKADLPPADQRRYDLVNANDKGHIAAMLQLVPPASPDEIQQIRQEERQIQGVTQRDEAAAQRLIDSRQVMCDGRLTVLQHDLKSSVAITDFIAPELGGPGYENLLTISKRGVNFYGARRIVERLASTFPPPASWSGGGLDEIAFWGSEQAPTKNVVALVVKLLDNPEG